MRTVNFSHWCEACGQEIASGDSAYSAHRAFKKAGGHKTADGRELCAECPDQPDDQEGART